jgi:hypothetical protein
VKAADGAAEKPAVETASNREELSQRSNICRTGAQCENAGVTDHYSGVLQQTSQ